MRYLLDTNVVSKLFDKSAEGHVWRRTTRFKRLANKRDVPYQSLLKIFLAERVEAELRRP